jgi:hypothetical protein
MDDEASMADAPSDEELLAALAVVLNDDEPVPMSAVEAAIASFTWHSIDAELLELLYDSAIESETLTEVREPASPNGRQENLASRWLTFASPSVEVELKLSSEQGWLVRGAIIPVGRYEVELQQGSDLVAGASSDAGVFELTAIDTRQFRLIITTDTAGGRLVTPWIDLTQR